MNSKLKISVVVSILAFSATSFAGENYCEFRQSELGRANAIFNNHQNQSCGEATGLTCAEKQVLLESDIKIIKDQEKLFKRYCM